MKTRRSLALLTIVATIFGALLVSPAVSKAQEQITIPLSTAPYPMTADVLGGGTFEGTMTITNFDTANGMLSATGVLEGTVTDPAGNTLPVSEPAALPISSLQAAPGIGNNNCLALVLQAENVLLQVQLLGLNVMLETPQINLVANAQNNTPVCDLLNNVVGLLNELLADPATLVALLNQLLQALPADGTAGTVGAGALTEAAPAA